MSLPNPYCEVARLAIHKQTLMEALDAVRDQIKGHCADLNLPFTVEIDNQAVTVRKPQYRDGIPQTHVTPLIKGCMSTADKERYARKPEDDTDYQEGLNYSHMRDEPGKMCPDGGTCHHACGEMCWRVKTCVPLSSSGWDDWPEEIKRIHG